MTKRVLTIQDISCVGQCSLTVALPVLSACGVEAAALPTAVLSTHTGGFGAPAVRSLEEFVSEAENHWRVSGITFDAFLTGYLGKASLIEEVLRLSEHCAVPGAKLLVDPAMADHGRYYTGLDDKYGEAMAELCRRADVILPNLTEACFLTGTPWRNDADPAFAEDLIRKLRSRFPVTAILTGVHFSPDETGILLMDEDGLFVHRHPRFPKNYSGTGDAFSAAFAGLLTRGLSARDAAREAADFAGACIADTAGDPDHWYGIRFESRLRRLMPDSQS